MPDSEDPFNKLTHLFIWLAGASARDLQECPKAEQRKYVAFGATVLVPCIFALITAAYAVSTLTEHVAVIIAVALVWSFIILTVDRALLATYRAHQPFARKMVQFTLRLCVAVLMGLTISHPLTLLLFKDTISSIIERDRDTEVHAVRTKYDGEKRAVQTKLAALDAEIATARKRWDDSFDAKFLSEPGADAMRSGSADQGARAELENKITVAQAPILERQGAIEKEIGDIEARRKALQIEIDHWQAEFEREIDGKRSGMSGVGPRAKTMQDVQLAPRRAESERLSSLLETRTKERNDLRAEAAAVRQAITTAEAAKANELATTQRNEQAQRSALRQQIAEQQAGQFVAQQAELRASLKLELEALLAQAKLLRGELTQLVEEGAARVLTLRTEPRRDLLKQTLALHSLFNEGAEGGTFALVAYIVLTLLFMLVDTIPVIVKFFSKAGPYDDLLDQLEVASDRKRRAFLQPEEQALLEDQESRRARKEFLERHSQDEAEFAEHVRAERLAIAQAREAGHTADAQQRELALGERVRLFYDYATHAHEKFFKHAYAHAAEGEDQTPHHRRDSPALPLPSNSQGDAPYAEPLPDRVENVQHWLKPKPSTSGAPAPLSPAAAKRLESLREAHRQFAVKLRAQRQALAVSSDSEDARSRATALDEEEAAFLAELQAEWEDLCANEETATSYVP
ncbi:MAG: DUF4407 domain-containing protein [Roseimicrobium sp.]